MKKVLIFSMLIISLSGYSQEPNIEKDTSNIETTLNTDLDKANNNQAMALAMGKALDSYDKLLNVYYKKSLSKIKAEDKKLFTETQKAWIAWKEKEFKLISLKNSPKYSGFSDIMLGTNVDEQMKIIKSRVIDLYSFWEILSLDITN